MAPRSLPVETPSRTARPTRRATAEVDRGGRLDTDIGSSAETTDGRALGGRRQLGELPTGPAPSPRRRPTPRSATHNSTMLFRALLLIAAAAALAFTVAALLAPPRSSVGRDATSPDAPPPAVFVQPDR